MKDFIITKIISSKKFWYTLGAIAIQVGSEKWGISPETSQPIVYAIIALVLGQGMADFGKEK